jgi:hypothetical protein
MGDADLGHWQPLAASQVANLFADCPRPWWIAGGYAIDAFVKRTDRRSHEDIDVGLLDRDQLTIRNACLPGWDLHCADPPGTLRLWRPGEVLREPVHDVWCRERSDLPWALQLVINPSTADDWIYRRDPRIRRPIADLLWRSSDIPYLVPEVQLLFKSKTVRPKDEQDFRDSLPLLRPAQSRWLRSALRLTDPEHRWLAFL